jgi:dienelactone hydrolase
MTRRELLGVVALSPGFSTGLKALGAAQATSLTRFRNYSRCLPDYLGVLAKAAATKRDAELNKLTSHASVEARQKWVRETLWEVVGGRPERTPLNPRTTGTLQRAGYRINKVVYESRPNLFIPANLYVPEQGQGPFPAVLFQSGHYWEAKAYPSYQRCCQGLVQLGFVVLAFDPMGQGERINYLDKSGTRSLLPDCDAEHTVPGKQFLLFGDSSARFQLWDAIRSLDYLSSLPIVDAKRIASVGHSGGGTLTMLLAAADERLAAAAVCMGNTENIVAEPFRAPGSTDDAEQDLVNSGPAGFDRWDLLYPIAPKPLLVWPSDRDFFGTYSPDYISNGLEQYGKLKKVYTVLGRPERLEWADSPLPHALAYDSRLLVYNWFARWLQGNSQHVDEPPVKPEPVSALWATQNGSVVRELNSVTPFMLIKTRSVQRSTVPLESLLKTVRPANNLRAQTIGQVKSRNVLVEVLEVVSGPAVWLPAYLLMPDNVPKNKPVVLALDEAPNNRLWFNSEVDQTLPEVSPVICAADIRGVGALTPEFSPGHAEYEQGHQREENYAWSSVILGRPLVGQRTSDILALTAALRNHPATSGRPIYIAAFRRLTVPALFAAALDASIQGLYLCGGLVSFQNLAETEIYHYPFANFVPNLLNHTDIPDLAAALAPRKVVLGGAINAEGHAMQPSAVRNIYQSAQQAGNLSIRESADWSVELLTSVPSLCGQTA